MNGSLAIKSSKNMKEKKEEAGSEFYIANKEVRIAIA